MTDQHAESVAVRNALRTLSFYAIGLQERGKYEDAAEVVAVFDGLAAEMEVPMDDRYIWLIGCTITGHEITRDGHLTTLWVEKEEIRARVTMRPELCYDPLPLRHIDGSPDA